MSLRKTIYTGGFDWLTFGIYLILVLIGAISLYSVEYNPNARFEFFNIAGSQGKYLIIIVFSVLLFYLAYLIEWRFWSSFSIPIYGLGIFFLILVLIIGSEIKGSKSWFNLMGFSFQPSEFAKLATAMAISAYFSQFKRDIHQNKIVFQAFGLIFIPVFLILLQPDAGSALIFMSIFLLFYRIGLPHFYYLIGAILIITFILTLMYNPGIVSLGASIIAIVILSLIFIQNRWVIFLSISIGALSIYFYLFYFGLPVILILGILLLIVSIYFYMKKGYGSAMLLPMSLSIIMALSYGTDFVFNNLLKAHQQDRINVWLNPEKCDPRGSLYNVLQARTAIGSGGLFGKGFLQGNMTHLNYVPEQATDFIFFSYWGRTWLFWNCDHYFTICLVDNQDNKHRRTE